MAWNNGKPYLLVMFGHTQIFLFLHSSLRDTVFARSEADVLKFGLEY